MYPVRSCFTVSLLTLTALTDALGAGVNGFQQTTASSYLGGSGLSLHSGATLAPPKILNLGSKTLLVDRVVEDQDGTERRTDTDAEVTYELSAEVLFAKDSSRLTNSAQSRITSIATEIKQKAVTRVRVFGFTDDLGSAAHGDVLSRQRADAVKAVLADELPSTISFETKGYGERHPVASNRTEVGRQENRRVEISFPQRKEATQPFREGRELTRRSAHGFV